MSQIHALDPCKSIRFKESYSIVFHKQTQSDLIKHTVRPSGIHLLFDTIYIHIYIRWSLNAGVQTAMLHELITSPPLFGSV